MMDSLFDTFSAVKSIGGPLLTINYFSSILNNTISINRKILKILCIIIGIVVYLG